MSFRLYSEFTELNSGSMEKSYLLRINYIDFSATLRQAQCDTLKMTSFNTFQTTSFYLVLISSY